MRWLIWVVFALVMLLWTAFVLVGTKLLGWAVGLLASGQDPTGVSEAVQNFPWPAWLSLWIDPAWLQQLAEAVTQSWAWLTTVLPVIATVAGWLVPLAWIFWGIVALGMLGVALGLHVVSGRLDRRWAGVAVSMRGPHGH